MHDVADIIINHRRWEPPEPRPWPLAIPFGRYELILRIPAAADDECYWARLRGPVGFDKLVFVRRFAGRLDKRTLAEIVVQANSQVKGFGQVFEVGALEQWGFIASDLVEGASLVELGGHRIPWLVALAIAHDTCARLARCYRAKVDPAVTPARVIVSSRGEVTVCMGVPRGPAPFHRAVCGVLEPILALAATSDEQALLGELFADETPDAVWVVSDALVERHPELDPVLPLLFLAIAGRADSAAARAAIVERVGDEPLRGLSRLVNDLARAKCRNLSA